MNDLIHESLREHMHEAPVGFFCECDSPECFSSVQLTVTEYELGRRDPSWSIRASSH